MLLVPCIIPDIENAAFHHNETLLTGGSELPHNETAVFGCNPGYVIQGPEIYRCSFGDFINIGLNQTSQCIPGPCELPRISHGEYMSGYRAGLTIANGSTFDYNCPEPDYSKITQGPVQCRLGELVPDFPACRTRSDRYGVDGTL